MLSIIICIFIKCNNIIEYLFFSWNGFIIFFPRYSSYFFVILFLLFINDNFLFLYLFIKRLRFLFPLFVICRDNKNCRWFLLSNINFWYLLSLSTWFIPILLCSPSMPVCLWYQITYTYFCLYIYKVVKYIYIY